MRWLRKLLVIGLALVAAGCVTARPDAPGGRARADATTVGIIAVNDFHGALEPPKTAIPAPNGKGGIVPVPAGGAAWLASAIDAIRAQYRHSVTVGAGDLISASQLPSSLFIDEPAIGVLNRIGMDLAAVGNHEFDHGREELLRKQAGGCAQHTARKPCQVERFAGARFRYLAASTIDEAGRPFFPATAVRSFGTGRARVKVGFVGLTLRNTPNLVSPDGIRGLTFLDEAETINAAIPVLRRQGVSAIVVLIHEGGLTAGPPDPDGCAAFAGPIRDIISRLDPGVDVIVSGHTHWAYVCDYRTLDPAHPLLLTSAGVSGQLVSDIRLEIDPAARRVVSATARNVIVQSAPYETASSRGPVANTDLYPRFAPRADVAEYVARYVEAARLYTRRAVGKLAGPALRSEGDSAGQTSPLGNLIADAQLAASAGAGAQIAFMNPFGIRARLDPAPDGTLTFGDIYSVQPFNNTIVTQTMTGEEIKAMLEEGLDGMGPDQLLNPSAGMVITIDRRRPARDRIVALTLDGRALDPAASYRVTTNSFLAGGGDGFSLLRRQRDAVIGVPDIEALERWLQAVPPRPVPQESRLIDLTRG